MLTLRGEHFYFVANIHCYTELYAPTRAPEATPDTSWRDRVASLRNVRPLLRMVWETSPALTLATAVPAPCCGP